MNDTDVIAAFRVIRAMLRDAQCTFTVADIARMLHRGDPRITTEDLAALVRVETAIDEMEKLHMDVWRVR